MISVGVAASGLPLKATKMLDPGRRCRFLIIGFCARFPGFGKPEPVLFEIFRFVARIPK